MPEKIMVTRSSMPPLEEYVSEIAPLWESHWLTNMGEKHQRFERALCEYLSADYASLFVNGHSALECILEALGLGADEVAHGALRHAEAEAGACPPDVACVCLGQGGVFARDGHHGLNARLGERVVDFAADIY